MSWHNGAVSGEVPCVLAAGAPPSSRAGAARWPPTGRSRPDGTGVDVRPRALLDRSRGAADVLFDARRRRGPSTPRLPGIGSPTAAAVLVAGRRWVPPNACWT